MSFPHNQFHRLVAFGRVEGGPPYAWRSGSPRMGFVDQIGDGGDGVFTLTHAPDAFGFEGAWLLLLNFNEISPGLYMALRNGSFGINVTTVNAAGAPLRAAMTVALYEFIGPPVF